MTHNGGPQVDEGGLGNTPSGNFRVQQDELNWDDLPPEAKQQIIEMSAAEISERLAKEEVLLQAVNPLDSSLAKVKNPDFYLEVAKSLNEQQLGVIGENIQPHDVVTDTEEVDMTAQSSLSRVLDIALLDYPVATLYALGVVTFMLAFYLQSILIALAGAAILIVTALHYAD